MHLPEIFEPFPAQCFFLRLIGSGRGKREEMDELINLVLRFQIERTVERKPAVSLERIALPERAEIDGDGDALDSKEMVDHEAAPQTGCAIPETLEAGQGPLAQIANPRGIHASPRRGRVAGRDLRDKILNSEYAQREREKKAEQKYPGDECEYARLTRKCPYGSSLHLFTPIRDDEPARHAPGRRYGSTFQGSSYTQMSRSPRRRDAYQTHLEAYSTHSIGRAIIIGTAAQE